MCKDENLENNQLIHLSLLAPVNYSLSLIWHWRLAFVLGVMEQLVFTVLKNLDFANSSFNLVFFKYCSVSKGKKKQNIFIATSLYLKVGRILCNLNKNYMKCVLVLSLICEVKLMANSYTMEIVLNWCFLVHNHFLYFRSNGLIAFEAIGVNLI